MPMSDHFPRDRNIVNKTQVDSMLAITDEQLRKDYAEALLTYLIYGKYKPNPKLKALMTQQEAYINGVVERYDGAVENGKKGGRPTKSNEMAVYQYVEVEGHNKKEAAEEFGISVKTVGRYIDKAKAQILEEQHFDEETGMWNF